VGDLAFVVAQTQWSTALLPIATPNVIPADVNLGLFEGAIGDVAQGYTTALTRTQTSWKDTGGRLPANQVFIATACGFQVFLRNSTVTNATAIEAPFVSQAALNATARNLSWEVTIGDGITRNYGSLLDYAGFGGVFGSPVVGLAVTTAVNSVLGADDCQGRKLRIPLIFPPNIAVRIRVRGGNSFNTGDINAGDNTLVAGKNVVIKQFLHGYSCTMPAG